MTGVTHQSCTKMACAINNIEDQAYVTRHQSEACDCASINVDIDAMCDILDGPGNEVPLLSFQNVVGANAISLKIKPAGDMCPFVAISHVWSNGLGNPNANSLPECQLKYIRDLLLSTTTQENMTADEAPITFWMDTLCVPVGDTLRQPRTKAIARMRRTYEDAATVLVLDSSLQQLSLQNSHVELLLQIVASPWFTRLRTLQEGALARRLAFAFRDGVMDIDDFMRVNLTDRNGWLVSGMHEPLKHRINHLRGLLRLNFPSERSQDPFSAILELFRDRQTTKASDEGICLATLLGLDPTDLINAPADQRMILFYQKVKLVPSLALLLKGPRLSKPGLRWAPQTFLVAGNHQTRNTPSRSICNITAESGLKCPSEFFVLSLSRLHKDPPVQSKNFPPTRRIFLRRTVDGVNGVTYQIYQLIISETWNSDEEQKFPLFPNLKHPIVICGQSLQEMQSIHGALVTFDLERTSNEESKGGKRQVLHAKYETIIQIWLMSVRQFRKLDEKLQISRAFRDGLDEWTEERGVAFAELKPGDTDLWIS